MSHCAQKHVTSRIAKIVIGPFHLNEALMRLFITNSDTPNNQKDRNESIQHQSA